MQSRPSRHMDIRVKTHDGKMDHVKDEHGQDAPSAALPANAELVGEIFWAENSPGCVYYRQGGMIFRVCS
jgi:hypothetical protein